MEPRFGPLEEEEAERLAHLAIEEDIPEEDVTSASLIPAGAHVRGAFVPRTRAVVCGIPVVIKLFSHLERGIACRALRRDGEEAEPGQAILEVEGPARPILAGERSAL